jgi:GNAT superfamily N-acetyltransferase
VTRFDDLATSEVRSETDALLLVHHATREWGFDPAELAPFTHFGTRAAARQRMFEWGGARLISGLLDIKKPLYLPDLNDNHSLDRLLGLIGASDARRRFGPTVRNRILAHEDETGEGFEMLAAELRAAGYDGIGYRNHHEDPGSMSWMILSPDQLRLVRDGPIEGSCDPWEHDAEAFTGPAIVLPVFEIDGRDETYDHLWEALAAEGTDLPDLARSRDGWTARWLVDWEPKATMGLLDPDGTPRGFYMGGQLWVDPEARGAGRSALLIGAAADLLGAPPTQNTSGLGFSPAGFAAHLSAWRRIREEAENNGYLDLGWEDPNP